MRTNLIGQAVTDLSGAPAGLIRAAWKEDQQRLIFLVETPDGTLAPMRSDTVRCRRSKAARTPKRFYVRDGAVWDALNNEAVDVYLALDIPDEDPLPPAHEAARALNEGASSLPDTPKRSHVVVGDVWGDEGAYSAWDPRRGCPVPPTYGE